MNILGKYNLILGSASPRRKQIMEESGIPFTQKVIPIDESYPSSEDPEEVPSFLARKKAIPFNGSLTPHDILLTSDSIVLCDDTIMGKPKNAIEAKSMLKMLSGKKHKVISAVCLTHITRQEVFSIASVVTFNPLTSEEIDYYIENYKPFDKAGSYGIQEWIGHCKIPSIEGSYLNIVGLPMQAVYERLKQFVKDITE